MTLKSSAARAIATLTKLAETELLELVRGEDAEQFTITITRDNGRWSVTSETTDSKAVGAGSTFAEAWNGQTPFDAEPAALPRR